MENVEEVHGDSDLVGNFDSLRQAAVRLVQMIETSAQGMGTIVDDCLMLFAEQPFH